MKKTPSKFEVDHFPTFTPSTIGSSQPIQHPEGSDIRVHLVDPFFDVSRTEPSTMKVEIVPLELVPTQSDIVLQ